MPCCLYLSEDSNALAYISVGAVRAVRAVGAAGWVNTIILLYVLEELPYFLEERRHVGGEWGVWVAGRERCGGRKGGWAVGVVEGKRAEPGCARCVCGERGEGAVRALVRAAGAVVGGWRGWSCWGSNRINRTLVSSFVSGEYGSMWAVGGGPLILCILEEKKACGVGGGGGGCAGGEEGMWAVGVVWKHAGGGGGCNAGCAGAERGERAVR